MLKEEEKKPVKDIAIIGISAKLPNMDTLDDYWDNIQNGVDCIRPIPKTRKADMDAMLAYMDIPEKEIQYYEAAYLDNIDQFDHEFFRIPPKEASLTDVNQRLFMETAWGAMEDAGYGNDKLSGTNTGVYVGFSNNIKDMYMRYITETMQTSALSIVGNLASILSNRISYLLNLKGPSIVVDTACSSSLVAVAMACQAIRNKECDMAIAGGVKLHLMTRENQNEKIGMESPDYRTKTFDDSANGAGMGEGVTALLLKPLESAQRDGDQIYAVIKGLAINQDGSSGGLTVPNPSTQAELIVKAWQDGNIDPETISYFEPHGTGTELGDPIEIKGIQNAFKQYTSKKQFCAIGSVKTNIGHLYEAAGTAGLIKAILALKNKKLPPTLNFQKPNRSIDFSGSPVYVNTTLRDWTTDGRSPRRCGISSFGIGGTNCHLVLEEAPVLASEHATERKVTEPAILTLSAKTEESLRQMINKYIYFLEKKELPALQDICYTANTGRGKFPYRAAVLCTSHRDLHDKLIQLEQSEQLFESSFGSYIYTGFHKLVQDEDAAEQEFRLSPSSRHELSLSLGKTIEEFTNSQQQNMDALHQAASIYVSGGDANWEVLYSNEKVMKVSLPSYAFQTRRCWIDIPKRSKNADKLQADRMFYQSVWKQHSPISRETSISTWKGTLLFFQGEDHVTTALSSRLEREPGAQVIRVTWGQHYEKRSDYHYVIRGVEQDYMQLLEDIKGQGLTDIIHGFTLAENYNEDALQSEERLELSQKRGIQSAFYLTRALLHHHLTEGLRLQFISSLANAVTGHENLVRPENATLNGFAKVIEQEYPEISCRFIDVDALTDADALFEALTGSHDRFQIAYRNNQPYVEELDIAHIQEAELDSVTIRENGLYLIAGGTGGIGLQFARHLADGRNIRLALVSRTGMPQRSQWDMLIQEDHTEKLSVEMKERMTTIMALEAQGTSVELIQADISNMGQMTEAIHDLKAKYGPIYGVIHSAGVANDGMIIRKEESAFDEVLRPKVQGTWILDQLTAQEPLDFFVMFSSGISMLGEPGQSDYVAANCFLDSFAAYREKSSGRTLTINWPAWKEAGMAARFGLNVDTAFKTLPTNKAISAFDMVLNRQIRRVLIGEPNYTSELLPLLESSRVIQFSEALKIRIQRERNTSVPQHTEPSRVVYEQKVELHGRANGVYTTTEKELAQLVGYVLGFTELDVYDNLFELGVDSISMMRIITEIRVRYHVHLNYHTFFEGMNMAKLAVHLVDALKQSGKISEYPQQQPDPETLYEDFPLTEVQMAYLLGRDDRFEMGGTSTHYYLELETRLDMAHFQRALQKVIQRHPMLRAIILPEGVQRILPQVPEYQVEIVDLSGLGEQKQWEQIELVRDRMSHHVFKPDQWPLFEFKAFKIDDARHYLLFGYDLLICDSASIQILGEDLVHYCREPENELPPLQFSFKDYMMAYSQLKNSEMYARDKEYWIDQLETFPSAPALPLKQEPRHIKNPQFSRLSWTLGRESWTQLKQKAQQNNVTPSALLCAAFARVLARWSNQDRLAINLAAFNRFPFHEETDRIIGDFTSIMLLEISEQKQSTFWEQAKNVQRGMLDMLEHRHYDGVEFIRELARHREAGTSAIMPIVYTSTLFVDAIGSWQHIGELKMGISQTSQVYLDNQVMETDGQLTINWDHIQDLFDDETLSAMFNEYTSMIIHLSEQPNVEFVPSLPERDEMVWRIFNATAQRYTPSTLHGAFMEQVTKSPHETAVIYNDQQLTYQQLHERSNQLAHYLMQQGVTRGDRVGLFAERGIETIVNVIGILKAGAAYVPVDPDYPEERQHYILHNSNCNILLRPDVYDTEKLSSFPVEPVRHEVEPHELAYIIYTSGSTGTPKGVATAHGPAMNTIHDINMKFEVNGQDRILGISSMCFDLSVYDIFGALAAGAALVIVADQRDIHDMYDVIQQSRVTIWNSVPAIMQLMTEYAMDQVNEQLRLVLLSGDWIPKKLPEQVQNGFPSAQVISLGGATEASIWSIYYPVNAVGSDWNSIPYGRPLANQTFYTLDFAGRISPVDVIGELCIGGVGLAEGYFNDPLKTDQAFFNHPELGRLYRTGDFGVLRRAGYIEFLGRRDSQVKIRGYRVELGEIESKLAVIKGVKQAVVMDKVDEHGTKTLVAYYSGEHSYGELDIKRLLAQVLPDYMVPQHLIRVEQFPLTPNGKVDRKALPEPVFGQYQSALSGTESPTEQKLVALCESVFGLHGIGIRDSFFQMGINSIKMVQLVNRIDQEFNRRLSFREFMALRDIYELADLLEKSFETEPSMETVHYPQHNPSPDPEGRPFPLTEVQMAYVAGRSKAFEMGGTSTHGYLEFESDLDMTRFNEALIKVIEHHPMLRAIILSTGEQRILPEVPAYKLDIEDISMLSPGEMERLLTVERERMSHHIFELEQWPLFEIRAKKISEHTHLLLFGYDLLIADGASIQIFNDDLLKYYHHPDLKPEPILFTFRDYILAYNEFRKSSTYQADKSYWLARVEEFPAAPALPLKTDPTRISEPKFKRLSAVFESEQWESLKKIANGQGLTPSSLLCAAYARILSYWSNQPRLALNLTVFNRYPFHPSIQRMIGDFTSMILIDVDMTSTNDFMQQVGHVQNSILEALEHRHYEGIEFIRDLSKHHQMGNKTVMPIVFTSMIFNERDASDNTHGLIGKVREGVSQTSQVYLDHQASDAGGQLTLTWDYVQDLFDEQVIETMFAQYTSLLKGLITGESSLGPDLPAADLSILERYNDSAANFVPTTLQHLFDITAKRYPNQDALLFGDERMSYAELDQKSGQLAGYLLEQKIGRGDRVGVMARRRMETIVNIMAVLRTGAAYVPLEPEYPEDRRAYMIANSECRVVLDVDAYVQVSASTYGVLEGEPYGEPDDLAYVIYTSGSTGRPKGVAIAQGAVSNTIQDMNRRFGVHAQDRIIGVSSMCFDLSVYDIFGALSSGAALVLVSDQRDMRLMMEAVDRHRVTIWNSVPALMDMFTDRLESDAARNYRWATDEDNLAAVQQSVVTELEEPLYHWSFSTLWRMEGKHVYVDEFKCPECASLMFPELYFLAQKGIRLSEITPLFPELSAKEVHSVTEILVRKRALVSGLMEPVEIFKKQAELFRNPYDEKVAYDAQAYESFKKIQLNRTFGEETAATVQLERGVKYPDFISKRRSHRSFIEDQPITLEQFSNLIGVLGQYYDGQETRYYYPSAGGLYPIDVFVYVKEGRVTGMKAGLYYFSPVEHTLRLIHNGSACMDEMHYYTNKSIYASSAFTVFFIYNAEATMPKYGAQGYLYSLLDTGIMVSTLNSVGEMLGIGMCSIGDMLFEKVKPLFGLNENQIWLHTVEAGLRPDFSIDSMGEWTSFNEHSEKAFGVKESGYQDSQLTSYIESKELKVSVLGSQASVMSEVKLEESILSEADKSVQRGDRASSLRLVMLSGDWIPLALPDKIRNLCLDAHVVSLGGATEASIWSIFYPIDTVSKDWKSIPYGYPLANQTFHVLDYHLRSCPVDVPGELFIGGSGLANQYVNDPEKTEQAFIQHHTLGRLYRTGDHGVMRKEGYIEFLGRKDNQIKIRGHRVELGEIEAVLVQHPELKRVYVMDRLNEQKKKVLCAYYVSDGEISITDLREFLISRLPEYMVPSFFIRMESFPLTPNGKMNRAALPEPTAVHTVQVQYQAPASNIEKQLVQIWSEVLGNTHIGVNQHFFEIGGDSVLMIKAHAKLDDQYPGIVKITDMFNLPTISDITAFIEERLDEMDVTHVPRNLIPLSADFFIDVESTSNEIQELQFALPSEHYNRVIDASRKWKVEEDDILFAAFAYLLAQTSNHDQLKIHAAIGQPEHVQVFDLDFGTLERFDELFTLIHQSNHSVNGERFHVKYVNSLVAESGTGTLPLFYNRDSIASGVPISELYDLTLQVVHQETGLQIVCSFRSMKWRKNKVESLLQIYFKLLNAMLE
nr:non-ribosomal peptide synthetase [Paenibacillus polysaccharolyticus]